jgi:lipoyl-dependent peroxiredoxin
MLPQAPAKLLPVTTNEEVGMATRNAKATWRGNLKEGAGTMGVGSGSWEGPFTFRTRFEDEPGTNPEELIAAAEAGCFTMALSAALSEGGHAPDSVETEAKVTLRNVDGLPTITQIDLATRARVPGLDDDAFQTTAAMAREQCIISRALGAVDTINLEATLES